MMPEKLTLAEFNSLQAKAEEPLSDDGAILFDKVRHLAGLVGRVNKLAADAESLLEQARVKALEQVQPVESSQKLLALDREVILDAPVSKENLALNRLERMSKHFSDKIVAGQSLLKAIHNERGWSQEG